MTKQKLRRNFFEVLKLLKDKWNLAFAMGWSYLIWLTATAYNHVGELLFILFLAILAIGMMYFSARGR